MTAPRELRRIFVLGASNVARGLHIIVETARNEWGAEIEIIAAQGHGRSYGVPSKMLVRSIPSIVDCGLWPALSGFSPAPALAVITDIGNDLLFGFTPRKILDWVQTCIDRLRPHAAEFVIAGPPMGSIRRISASKFLLMRTILFPGSRQSLADVAAAAQEIDNGLAEIAAAQDIRFIAPRSEWYGFDPIHILRGKQRAAWREILLNETAPPSSIIKKIGFRESAQLYFLPPEQRRLFGKDQFTAQSGHRSRGGGRIWLY